MHPNDGRVVSNFIVQALQNRDITIYGSGRQTRSFCYVDDLVDGLLRLMNSDDSFTGPVNLGSPEEISISDLAELSRKLTGSASDIVNLQAAEDDPVQRRPSIDLAKRELLWEPTVMLSDGLKDTIDYFRNIL
jgi:UDP-glucuronate decarboxylase